MALTYIEIADVDGVRRKVACNSVGDVFYQILVADDLINPSNVATTPWAQDAVTTAQGLPSLPGDATHALISVEGDAIRWKPSGTATVSEGILVFQGGQFILGADNDALDSVSICSTGTSGVNVVYFAVPA